MATKKPLKDPRLLTPDLAAQERRKGYQEGTLKSERESTSKRNIYSSKKRK